MPRPPTRWSEKSTFVTSLRLVDALERREGERLVGRDERPPSARGASGGHGRRTRPERAAGGDHRLVRPARRDLERQPEARARGELGHEVVEHRQAR